MTAQNLPPTLPGTSPVANSFALKRDPLAFFTRLAREAGDFAHYVLGAGVYYFVNDPALVREILVTQEEHFSKWAFSDSSKQIFGNGLINSEEPLHRQVQRVVRPAFLQGRLAGYARQMTALTGEQLAGWAEGEIDLSRELTVLTLEIMARCFFSVSMRACADTVYDLSNTLQRYSNRLGSAADDDHAFATANAVFDDIARALLQEQRRAGHTADDVLGLLLHAQRQDPATVTEAQLHDEMRTFIMTGHFTTASVLASAFWLLAGAPEAERKLHRQLDAVLGGRPPGLDDLPALSECEQIFLEALRLHPPVWTMGREALREVQLGDYTLPAGAKLAIVPWLLHRDARYFPEPERFLPARWADGLRAQLPRGAYLPFSAGSRSCLGERFAMMEGTLLLATVAQRWRFSELPGAPHPGWSPQLILWPRRGVRLRAERRRSAVPVLTS